MAANSPLILLMGPTAAGKTEVAVELLGKLPCEIISVDSALVYRGMDIGTAKPDAKTLARAPHRLINIREPHEVYSAADFCADAEQAILDIQARGHIPLLVGGTLLYFRVLQQGLADMPAANPEIRAQLQADLEQQGLARLHARLSEVDAIAAERIHVNDPQRILRALEVWLVTGKSLSAHHQQAAKKSTHHFIKIAWSPAQRELLHQRIEMRFAQMLEQGFVDEVAGLRADARLNPELPSMRAVGYRQVWQHLDGRISATEMSNKAIVATRQLAKRQLTWLRGESDVAWFDSQTAELSEVLNYIQRRL